MNTRDALAVVLVRGDFMVAPDLVLWLLEVGFTRERMVFTRASGRDVCAAFNMGVRLALESRFDRYVFADGDIRPDPVGTSPFLEDDGDGGLVCAMCPTECGARSWVDGAFHTGLWRSDRATLRGIGLPAFGWVTSADGSEIRECVCSGFARKARSLGFKVRVQGKAGHVPRPVDGLRDVVVFGDRRQRIAGMETIAKLETVV